MVTPSLFDPPGERTVAAPRSPRPARLGVPPRGEPGCLFDLCDGRTFVCLRCFGTFPLHRSWPADTPHLCDGCLGWAEPAGWETEMCRRVWANDRAAIAARFVHLPAWVMEKWFRTCPPGERENLLGTLTEALVRAARKFDPHAAGFSTFATRCLVNAARKHLRANHRKFNRSFRRMAGEPADRRAAGSDGRLDAGELLARVPRRYRRFLLRWLEAGRKADRERVAAAYRRTYDDARGLVRRLLKKLRAECAGVGG